MATADKLSLLGSGAQWDLCGPPTVLRPLGSLARHLYPAVARGGRIVNLFKVLLTNSCRYDCRYCAFRCSADRPRTSFAPDELAGLCAGLVRARRAEGLFLSSSVRGAPDAVMERMVDAARILRTRHEFEGYVHLKVLPGASRASIEAAARVADRISINLEAPGPERLQTIAPDKDWQRDLARRVEWIGEIVASRRFRARSHTTQFVVGAAGETDRELLACTSTLYATTGMKRAYFSPYGPPDPASHPVHSCGDPASRVLRLYQADWLIREYGFAADELPVDASGHLPAAVDPKRAWAVAHPERFPVEVNKASREELLRVPGIGPESASRIVSARREAVVRTLSQLQQLGVVTGRARDYVLLNGRAQKRRDLRQLALWDS